MPLGCHLIGAIVNNQEPITLRLFLHTDNAAIPQATQVARIKSLYACLVAAFTRSTTRGARITT